MCSILRSPRAARKGQATATTATTETAVIAAGGGGEMRNGFFIILGIVAGLMLGTLFAQTIVQRPRYPQTGLSFVGYGDAFPTTDPFGGEIFVDIGGQSDGGPLLGIYDDVNLTWDTFASGLSSTLTDNYIPVFDSALGELADSRVVDDGTDFAFSGVDSSIFFRDVVDLTGVDATVSQVELNHMLSALDAGDEVHGLLVDITDVGGSTGGTLVGIDIADITGSGTAALGLRIGDNWTRGLVIDANGSATEPTLAFDETSAVGFYSNGASLFQTVNGA